MPDPTATDPGSAEGRALGCICDPQEPRLIERENDDDCDCHVPAMEGAGQHSPGCLVFKPRKVWRVEPHCPAHGLAEMKAFLDG